MSKLPDVRDLVEASLKYDDHNPHHRKKLEEWLTRVKPKIETKPKIKKPIQTRTKPFKAIPKVSTPLNIDINLPKQLEFDFNFDPVVDQVVDYSPTKVDRNKVRRSTGIAKILGVNDD